jgi:glycosyltransferase involved in cell wall biosynthesis
MTYRSDCIPSKAEPGVGSQKAEQRLRSDAQAPPRLSIVAIARNEEQDLPGFLDSFMRIADELVLVDDGSTDRTCEIASRVGPRLKLLRSPRQAEEGFCHQRNKGIATASGDWLLHVDIDDRATDALLAEISEAIRQPDFDAYEYRFIHFFLNHPMRYGSSRNWTKPWLVRKGLATFEGVVHERLSFPPSARVGRLKHRMWHLGDDDFSERLRKNLTYSELEFVRLLQRGGTATLAGSCWDSAKAFVQTYIRHFGIADGRMGLFWALYVFSGTMNRNLLAYSRLHPHSRAELEQRVRQGGE